MLKKISLLKKKKEKIEFYINKITSIEKKIIEIKYWINLLYTDNDINIQSEIKYQYKILKKKVKNLEILNIFKNKEDILNCYIDIQSGSGGIESQDWSKILLKMYLKWSEIKGFKTEIINESEGEKFGLKSITIKIIGKYAFGWFRTESGIHRLIRKSPFSSGNKRHTSFCSVFIYPEIEKDIDIIINPSDIRIDVYRSSGSGGQHVNKTESAVRITHIPTKIVTQCQNNRSQHKNKNYALKQLYSKLYNFEIQKKKKERKKIEDKKLDIRWGNQIRSYILDNSLIKDTRTGLEIRDIQYILDGNLQCFIEKSLKLGL